jgi:hypothetical protein
MNVEEREQGKGLKRGIGRLERMKRRNGVETLFFFFELITTKFGRGGNKVLSKQYRETIGHLFCIPQTGGRASVLSFPNVSFSLM